MRTWDKSRRPTGPFVLNRDSWRAQGLVGWWPWGGPSAERYVPDLSGAANAHLDTVAGGAKIGWLPYDAPGAASLDGASQYWLSGVPAVTALPFSLASWCIPTTLDANEHTTLSVSGASTNALNRLSTVSTNKAMMQFRNSGGSTSNAIGTVAMSVGNLYHLGGRVSSGGQSAIWTNGGNKQTGTAVGGSMTAVQNTTVGALYRASTPELYFPGSIGECSAWSVALEDWQMEALADPGTRFELWYPLRSRKWIVSGAVSGGPFPHHIRRRHAGGMIAMAA